MKEGYAVSDSNVIKLTQPGVFTDTLTEVLRSGARALLTQAVEAEVETSNNCAFRAERAAGIRVGFSRLIVAIGIAAWGGSAACCAGQAAMAWSISQTIRCIL
jgi:hypothetical protein